MALGVPGRAAALAVVLCVLSLRCQAIASLDSRGDPDPQFAHAIRAEMQRAHAETKDVLAALDATHAQPMHITANGTDVLVRNDTGALRDRVMEVLRHWDRIVELIHSLVDSGDTTNQFGSTMLDAIANIQRRLRDRFASQFPSNVTAAAVEAQAKTVAEDRAKVENGLRESERAAEAGNATAARADLGKAIAGIFGDAKRIHDALAALRELSSLNATGKDAEKLRADLLKARQQLDGDAAEARLIHQKLSSSANNHSNAAPLLDPAMTKQVHDRALLEIHHLDTSVHKAYASSLSASRLLFQAATLGDRRQLVHAAVTLREAGGIAIRGAKRLNRASDHYRRLQMLSEAAGENFLLHHRPRLRRMEITLGLLRRDYKAMHLLRRNIESLANRRGTSPHTTGVGILMTKLRTKLAAVAKTMDLIHAHDAVTAAEAKAHAAEIEATADRLSTTLRQMVVLTGGVIMNEEQGDVLTQAIDSVSELAVGLARARLLVDDGTTVLAGSKLSVLSKTITDLWSSSTAHLADFKTRTRSVVRRMVKKVRDLQNVVKKA